MAAASSPIALLPAAGRGVRFGDSGYAKELFPLLRTGADDADLAPRPICELALLAMRAAGAELCVTVVSREKLELVRVLGDGHAVGMSIAYVVQPKVAGLPDVVLKARAWLGNRDVVFAMPDTVFLPSTALAEVNTHREQTGADLVLGVFPVDEPERLGPVDIGADGAVLRVLDKPSAALHRNSWGIASWSPRFTELCCTWEERRARERPDSEGALGHVFEAAREAGLAVRAVSFAAGRFLDIGTPRGLRGALGALATEGLLLPVQARTGPSGGYR